VVAGRRDLDAVIEDVSIVNTGAKARERRGRAGRCQPLRKAHRCDAAHSDGKACDEGRPLAEPGLQARVAHGADGREYEIRAEDYGTSRAEPCPLSASTKGSCAIGMTVNIPSRS